MAGSQPDRGSGHGVDRAVLETGVGSAGTRLAAGQQGKRGWSEVRIASVGPSEVQSRAPRTQERLCRCRTPAKAAGRERTGAELCTRHGATAMEDRLAAETAVDACPGAVTEPIGSTAGTGPSEAIESRLGSVGGKRTADVASAGRRGNRRGPASCAGPLSPAGYIGAVVRCARRRDQVEPRLPPAASDAVRRVEAAGTSHGAVRPRALCIAHGAPLSHTTVGGSARSGGGFGTADTSRSRRKCGGVPERQEPGVLGWRMSRRRAECGSFQVRSLAQRQPQLATTLESGGTCGGKDERQRV